MSQRLTNEPFKNQIYVFPIKLLEFQTLKGKHQFRSKLASEYQENPAIPKSLDLQIRTYKNKEIRANIKCRYCTAKIKYIVTDQVWILESFDNYHNHELAINKLINSKDKSDIKQTIRRGLSLKDEQNFINLSKKHQTSLAEYRNLRSEILHEPYFKMVQKELKELNYQYKYQFNPQDISREGLPDVLVAVSPLNKKCYSQYGQIVSYDITYNCISDSSFHKKKMGLGLFSGFDNNNRILVYGFSISAFQTTAIFNKIFTWFFSLMDDIRTTSIITDQQKTLTISLKQLQSQHKEYIYHNVFDSFHYIHTFKSDIKNIDQAKGPALIKQLGKVMKQHDPKMGNSGLQSICEFINNLGLESLAQKIIQKKANVCLWALPKKFFGLTLHSSQNLNDLLKRKIQQQTQLFSLLKKYQQLSYERYRHSQSDISFQKFEFEWFFNDPRLFDVRSYLQKRPFQRFIKNYRRTYFYIFQDRILPVENSKEINIVNFSTKFTYKITDWICQCEASEKMGIPCEHILFAFKNIYPNKEYKQLFNPIWISMKQNPYMTVQKLEKKKNIYQFQTFKKIIKKE